MDKATRDILSINRIKRDAQKKRMGINRKPGESLAAFVTRAQKHKEKMQKEEVEIIENKGIMKDYQDLKSQGKKDSAIIDILMSMPKYKSMSRDKMRKMIGDARRKGIFKESKLYEDAWEEIPMMKRQLRYIQVASKDIMEYISQCDDECIDPEEWFQNKLSHIHGQMQSLHSYVEGEHDKEDPEYDMDESYGIYEELKVSDGIESWIKDFYKSDAPQFKGKDKKERRDMAVAAYLSAKRKKEE